MSKPFDSSKPIQTRGGLKARIVCTDRKGEWPIVALVTSSDREDVRFFRHDGSWSIDDSEKASLDLINIPEEPKWRAWKPEEVPVGALFRMKPSTGLNDFPFVILAVDTAGIAAHWFNKDQTRFSAILTNAEYSIDPIGTPTTKRVWHPCGILE